MLPGPYSMTRADGRVPPYSPSNWSSSWVERVPSGAMNTAEMRMSSVRAQERESARKVLPSGCRTPGTVWTPPVPFSM